MGRLSHRSSKACRTGRLIASYAAMCLSLLLFSFVGCQAEPEMVQVTGVVQIVGQPLDGGRIIFEPLAKAEGTRSAIGDVADDGTFQLYTVEPGDGVVPGRYYAVVMDPKDVDTMKRRPIGVVDLKATELEVDFNGPNEFVIEITKEDLKYSVKDD